MKILQGLSKKLRGSLSHKKSQGSRPFSRKAFRQQYVMMSVCIYLLIVYCFVQYGYVATNMQDLSAGNIILATLEHIAANPVQILPNQWKYLGYGAFIGLFAPLIISSDYMRRKDLRPSIEIGSAKWNEDLGGFRKQYTDFTQPPKKEVVPKSEDPSTWEIIGCKLLQLIQNLWSQRKAPAVGAGTNNIIMADGIYLSMNTRKTQRNNNVVVIGGSGSQKTRGHIIPNIFQAGCSMVITDPSGELLASTGDFLRNQGYKIGVLNLVNMENSDCYNPFHYVQKDEDVVSMVHTLIQNTTPSGSRSNDPFWEKAETAIISACCYLVRESRQEEQRNFSQVLYLLSLGIAPEDSPSILDGVFAEWEIDCKRRHEESQAVKYYNVYKAAGGGKTAQSILISAMTRLQAFNLPAIKKLTDIDTIDLGSVGKEKTALFCVIPTADTTFNFIVAMMYSQLFNVLYRQAESSEEKRLPHHVRFLLDEFANIGTIPNFCQLLSTMRKYEISCTIVLQALSQVKALYKDEWEVLVGNCDSLLFLGGSDHTTLDYISKSLGKETIRSVNSSRSYGRTGGSSMSYNKAGRELMTPDELRTMDNQNCIYILRGLDPFFCRKYDLTKHPSYPLSALSGNGNYYDVTKEKFTGRHN